MTGLERTFESKHLSTMSTGYNKLARLLRINAHGIAKDIALLQSKQLKEPAKYGAQLSRSKKLAKLIQQNFDALEIDLFSGLNEQTENQWLLAAEKNTLLTQQFLGEVPVEFAKLNLDALAAFQKRNLNGLNLSKRIHNLTELNKQLYLDAIGTGITQGKSSISIARKLNEINSNPHGVTVFDKDGNPAKLRKISPVLKPNAAGRGMYRSPLKNLFRVTRTETNSAYRLSDYERIQQLDFVVGYEVHLSGSHLSSYRDMCDSLAGKYPKSFKFSGWHPNCLCYVTTILATKGEFRSGLPSKNEIRRVPDSAQRYVKTKDMSRYDWYKDGYNGKTKEPLKQFGGPSKDIKPYEINVSDKNYRGNENILKSAGKSVRR